MERFRLVFALVLFIAIGVGVFGQAPRLTSDEYWDEIELIDGQILHGVILDTVKEKVIIQLTTKDVISLPESSVRKVTKAAERAKAAAAQLALKLELEAKAAAEAAKPKASDELPVARLATSVTLTSKSKDWNPDWANLKVDPYRLLRIERRDLPDLVGNWVASSSGNAVVLSTLNQVVLVPQSTILRVESEAIAAPALDTASSPDEITASPPVPRPRTVTEFRAVWGGASQDADLATRGFVSSTPWNIGGGKLNVSLLDLAMTQLTFGFGDRFQVRAAFMPADLVSKQLTGVSQWGFQLGGPMVVGTNSLGQLGLSLDAWNLKWGGSDSQSLSVWNPMVRLGWSWGADWLTLGIGSLVSSYPSDIPRSSRPDLAVGVGTFSGLWHLGPSLGLMAEADHVLDNDLFQRVENTRTTTFAEEFSVVPNPETLVDRGLLRIGFRWFLDSGSVDVGAQVLAEQGLNLRDGYFAVRGGFRQRVARILPIVNLSWDLN